MYINIVYCGLPVSIADIKIIAIIIMQLKMKYKYDTLNRKYKKIVQFQRFIET